MVNTSELTGGAAIAANRLMNTLNTEGHEARMLVRDRNTESSLVSTIPNGAKQRCDFILERLGIFFENGWYDKALNTLSDWKIEDKLDI